MSGEGTYYESSECTLTATAEHNGSYTISVEAENIDMQYLHLIDNMTGADIDLLVQPSYSFEARTTDYESRFKLVYATGFADETFAFYSNGKWVINNDGDATLQVVDVMGRILSSEIISGCVNGGNVKTQKVVVR